MIITSLDISFLCLVIGAFAFGLRAGVAAIIFIRPLTDRIFELASYSVAGHQMTYGLLMNVIVLCATAINFVRIQRCTPSGLRYIWLPFLLVCAFATLRSPLPLDAVRRLAIYMCYYSMFGLSFVLIKSERDVALFMKLIVLSSALPVAFGLFETLSGIDWYDNSRIQSTFSHPNMLAFYLLAIIGVVLFLNTATRLPITSGLRLILKLYLIPLLIVLIMTKTRSAWIGCFAMFFVFGLMYNRLVLVLLLVVTPLALAVPTVHERIADLMSDNTYSGGSAVLLNSYAWRKILWESALTYIWQKPAFGYGLHSFLFYSGEFFTLQPGGVYAHNDYIQVLFELGAVGLAAFIWIFSRSVTWLMARWRFDRAAFTTAIAFVAIYLICSYSDNLLEYLPYQWEFWFAFAVICWHIECERVSFSGLSGRGQTAAWTRSSRRRRPLAAGSVATSSEGSLPSGC